MISKSLIRSGRVQIGEVLRIDDTITGFDDNKPGRPCCIVAIDSPPREAVWVVPRSTKGSTGTLTPAGVLPGLTQEGRFMFLPRRVPAASLQRPPSLGVLPEPFRTRVLENVNAVVIDLEAGT